MITAALIASISATLAILVALPGLIDWSYEQHPLTVAVTRALLGVAVAATVAVCVLAVA